VVSVLAGSFSDRSHLFWGGRLSARLGPRRPFIAVATLCAVPALLAFPQATTIGALAGVYCLLQLTINLGAAPYQALIPDLVPRSAQGTASAYMGVCGLVGQLGGLVLCGSLIEHSNGLAIIVRTIATVLVVATLWTLCFVNERPTAGRNEPLPTPAETDSGELPANALAAAEATAAALAPASLFESLRVRPHDHPDFFLLIASRFVINTGLYTATQFLFFYISDTLHAHDPALVFTQFSLLSLLAGMLGNFPAGLLSDRIAKKTVVYYAAALAAAGALLFVATSSIAVAYVAAFFFGMGFGAFQAVDWALATNLLPDRDAAKFMGLWNMAFTVPQVVAPFIGGTVAFVFNRFFAPGFGYRVVLCLVILYLLAGTLLIKPIRERTD
jgi:MFS family permease